MTDTIQAPAAGQGQPPLPDRAALERMIDLYLEALAANDPSRLPATPDVSFVENYRPLKLGEGTWGTIDGLGSYRHYFADPEAGQAGVISTVRENGTPAALDVRLRLTSGRISEIETFIIRDPLCCARLEEMGAPEDVWLRAVPPEERLPREAMIATVDKYFQSMQRNDGKGDYSFFHKACDRLEHGLQTTNVKKPMAYGHSHDTDFASLSAEEQWKTGFLGFVTEIRDRRFVVVDEERQAVFAFATFDHNGTIRQIDLTTGKVFPIPPYFDAPRTLQIMEAFKLKGDKLFRIEMTLVELPYGAGPPKPEPAPVKRDASAPTADAGALIGQVLAAMRAHDPGRLPLAKDVRYTENGQTLKVGDGLWGTLSAYAGPGGAPTGTAEPPAFSIALPGSAPGEAVWLGGIAEQSTPGMLCLRLGLDGGEIAQVEAIAVRLEEIGERGGTVSLFQPRLLTPFDPKPFDAADGALLAPAPDADARLTATVDRYFDAIEADSSKGAALAADCARRDNGVTTANNPEAPPLDPALPAFRPFALGCAAQIDVGLFRRIAKVRERRHIAVDAARGLVLSVAAFDNPGRIKALEVPGVGRANLPGRRAIAPGTEINSRPDEETQLFAARLEANVIVPTTELVVQLTKVVDGKISRIETISRGGPFGMSAGWDGQDHAA